MKKLLMLVLCGLTASVSLLAAEEGSEVAECGKAQCSKPCGCHKGCSCHKEKKSCCKPESKPACREKGSECHFENSLSPESLSQYNRFSDAQKKRAREMAREKNMSADQAVSKVAASG